MQVDMGSAAVSVTPVGVPADGLTYEHDNYSKRRVARGGVPASLAVFCILPFGHGNQTTLFFTSVCSAALDSSSRNSPRKNVTSSMTNYSCTDLHARPV